jgi:hypothetical protein
LNCKFPCTSWLGELVDTYCGGSIQTLVLNIIKSEKLSEGDLIALKRLAEGDHTTKPSATSTRK